MEDVIEKKIGNIIKIIAIAIFSIIFIYIVYDTHSAKEQIKSSTKTKDSLEALIKKYQYDYISIKKRADELDSLIKIKNDSVIIIKQRFYVYRSKEIKNPDEATKYIINFLKE